MEYKVNQAYEELKRLIQWHPDSEEKFLQKMVCLLLPGQRKCWSEAIRDLRQSFEAEQGMIFVEKYRGKLEWLNSISLAELQRKIGEIYFVDHYKMIADQFLYKKDFETSLFLRIAMETGIRSADIPCIEWSCMHGKTIILEETKRGDLYKKVNGTFPKISTQSLRIMKLLHRKQGKIFTKSNEYYVRKISCAWGMPGFRIHSFRDYRRKIEMGITAGVQVPRIIPL
jgi:integrase